MEAMTAIQKTFSRRKRLLIISILVSVAFILSALALILSRQGSQIYDPSPNITSCLCEASAGYASEETPYYLGELNGEFYSCVDSTLFSSDLAMCFHVHQLEGGGIDSIESLSLKNVNSGEIISIPADSDELILNVSENRDLMLIRTKLDNAWVSSFDENSIDIQGNLSIFRTPRAEQSSVGLLGNVFRALHHKTKVKKDFHLTTKTVASSSMVSACICSLDEREEGARKNTQLNYFSCNEENILTKGVPTSICLNTHDTKNYQIKRLLGFDVIHLMTGGIVQSVQFVTDEAETM